MLQGVELNRTGTVVLAFVAGFFAALAIGVLGAPTAGAQGPGSQFCDQYPSFPGCQEEPTGPTGPGPVDEPGGQGPGADAAGPGGPSADASAAGTLPFTGYPLTALILLLLILLLTGLAIRAYLAIRDRVIDEHTGV